MAVFQLLINGASVLAEPPGGATGPSVGPGATPDGIGEIVEFTRGYEDPAQLTIRIWDDPWQPRFGADAAVLLYRDGVLVFEGLTGLPRPVVSARDYPVVEYTAFDFSELLRRGTVVDDAGDATVRLAPGTLSSVVTQFLALVGEDLSSDRVGLPADVDYLGGAGSIACFPVTLEGESIDEGMRKIAASAPGVRVFMRPGAQLSLSKYAFVNLYGAPAYSLNIDETRVGDVAIEQSLEGRAGAVKTLQGQTVGQVDVEYDDEEDLTADWTAEEEALWTFGAAFERDKDGNRSNIAHVHRRFKFTDALIEEATPMVAMAETVPSEIDPDEGKWQRFAIESIDTTETTVTLVLPAITRLKQTNATRNNPFHPGNSKPAVVKLQYQISGTGSLPINIAEHRVPAAGFSGRAYQLAPRTCAFEKIISVPGGVSREQYAIDAFRAFSEPTINGSIPIEDDLPDDLWLLDRRINIAAPGTATTGYEALGAPLMGIRVTFAGGISSQIEFNRDAADLLGEGAR